VAGRQGGKIPNTCLDHRVRNTRDNLKEVIDELREQHGLLAANLDAAGSIDWRALDRPVSIDKLVAVASSERGRD
jgi:hypothetical protein